MSPKTGRMETHGIVGFELVVVNLYPFEATVARPGVLPPRPSSRSTSAAPRWFGRGQEPCLCDGATDAKQYPEILDQVRAAGSTTIDSSADNFAAAAFSPTRPNTTGNCRLVCPGFHRKNCRGRSPPELPKSLHLDLRQVNVLRYGENPHQPAGLYVVQNGSGLPWGGLNLVSARQLNGKELSYNNLLDLDSALAIVRGFASPAVAVIKAQQPLRRGRGEHPGRSDSSALRVMR